MAQKIPTDSVNFNRFVADMEEEVLKARLAIDGDGHGELRKFRLFSQNYLMWSVSNNPSPEDDQLTTENKKIINEEGLRRLLKDLECLKALVLKTGRAIETTEVTASQYKTLSNELQTELDNHKGIVSQIRENSDKAKRLKANKMECEAMVKLLKCLPDRQKKEEELKRMNEDLAAVKAQHEALEAKLVVQKQKLAILAESANDLLLTMS